MGAETEFYHISSGRDYCIKELFDATVRALGITLVEPVEVRPRNLTTRTPFCLSFQDKMDFGWSVSTPLEAGVAKAIEWYKGAQISETYTHLKKTKTA